VVTVPEIIYNIFRIKSVVSPGTTNKTGVVLPNDGLIKRDRKPRYAINKIGAGKNKKRHRKLWPFFILYNFYLK